MTDEELMALRHGVAKQIILYAAPVDTEQLTKDGILGRRWRGWFELLDPRRFPEHADVQVVALRQESANNRSRVFVKFARPSKRMARLKGKLKPAFRSPSE